MVLVDGTNCGFVTSAPSADPEATNSEGKDLAKCSRFQAPANGTISEIGFYVEEDGAGESRTMEVGIYEDNEGEPAALLEKNTIVTDGSDNLWIKNSDFSTAIVSGAYYWLAFCDEDTATKLTLNGTELGYENRYEQNLNSLEANWDTANDSTSTYSSAIYALYTESNSDALQDNVLYVF